VLINNAKIRIRDRLIKGTVLNFVAVSFNQGSTLLVNILVARILMKRIFGEYAMVQMTLLTVATLSQLATGYTASKYIAEYRSRDPERAGRIMGLCSVVSVAMAFAGTILLIAMAPWLAITMLKAPHLAFPLMLGSGYLFFSSINGYQLGALSGLEAFGGLAKSGVLSGVLAVGVIGLGAFLGGLHGALIGLSIAALVRFAIHNRWLRLESRMQVIKPQYKGSLSQEKAIIYKFALPVAIAGCYTTPMIWLANSFLVRQPGGYGEMGLYSAANNLRILVLVLPNVMNSVGLSVLNNEKANGDFINYNRVFRSNVRDIVLVSLGGVLFIGIFSRQILQLFGKDFSAGRFMLWVLLFASLFESVTTALYQYVQSQAKMWPSFFTIIVPREAFLVTAAYFLVQSYGGTGLAFAYLGSTIIGLIFCFSFVEMLYRKQSKVLGLYLEQ
jgi:O-antigen/teichoic acid export membrane protein